MSTSVVLGRLGVLSKTVLGRDSQPGSVDGYLALLAPAVEGDTNLLWLSHAAIAAVFPRHDEFERFRRDQALNGALPALAALVAAAKRPFAPNRGVGIRIATDTIVVDVHHTARTGLATGIQRVVRQTILQWQGRAEVELVGWDANFTGLRHLSAPERQNALHGSVPRITRPRDWVLTIPFGTTYILPELALERGRTDRISCLAEFSGNRTTVIGFDCVPLTSSETVGAGMSAAFANNLAGLAHFDRISTISGAAATEYRGWRQMLSGAGITGPEIEPLLLPSVAEDVSAADFELARTRLLTGDDPLVVCVGSHEPRKNHLAVLYAAERLWREGVRFQLVFIGGNGWNGDAFRRQLERLQGEGRPVKAISAVSDSLLWSAYRLSYVTVFPSLNEGFGLPVGESLSAGTPVVTSDFGSMKEIASGGGAIFVDPRDDDDVYRGMRAGLTDPELHARLSAEAAALPARGWSEYADALWQYFVPTSQPV
ncbi:glycosyltransferase [Subtercola sp. YIM 133946]|uniref:glycosyltransferase n=1 Tax=Subtercola sp. YIM 133946 TaxID=3118909 RepID=UPI002F9557CD